jgi:hypothetical protein
MALLEEEEASGFVHGACTTGRMLVPPQQSLPALENLRLLTLFRRVSINGDSFKALGPMLTGMFQVFSHDTHVSSSSWTHAHWHVSGILLLI